MSDARLVQAHEAMEAGKFQEAMALLKGILQEAPDDAEVRELLMECQAGMMLQLQVNEKLKKAKVLLEQGLRENADKILQEIVKADPTNQEALGLLHPPASAPGADDTASFDAGEFDMPPPLELPPLQEAEPADVTATDDFSMGALPSFGEMAPAGFPTAVDDLPELTPLESIDLAPAGGVESTVLSGPGPGSAEQARIRQYIEEGRALQAEGRTQEAVDTWTRVFILDEENQEVQGLIDAARSNMSGNQGEIEHALAEGIAAFNSGQPERARPLMEKVLQAFPGHKEAQYYLDRMKGTPSPPPPPPAAEGMGFELDADFGAPPPPPMPLPPAAQPFSFGTSSQPFAQAQPLPSIPAAGPDEFEFDTSSEAGGPFAAPTAPPPTGSAAVPPAPLSPGLAPEPPPPPAFEPGPLPFSGPDAAPQKKVTKGAGGGPNLKLILGGAAAVLVVAVGIFVAMKFLGGDDDKAPVPAIPAGGLGINAPASGSASNAPAGAPANVPPGQLITAADFIREARSAMDTKEYARALSYYQQALLKEKDNGEALAGLDLARQLQFKQEQEEARNQKFIKDYTFAVNAYKDGEYKESLTVAWRLIYPDDKLAQELGKAVAIRRILRDGYYNWAVKDLKVGNAKDAEKNLGEALTIDGGDAGAKNLLQFARKYAEDQPDALYWETVKSMTLRPFTEGP